jgi:hypothetical protein
MSNLFIWMALWIAEEAAAHVRYGCTRLADVVHERDIQLALID